MIAVAIVSQWQNTGGYCQMLLLLFLLRMISCGLIITSIPIVRIYTNKKCTSKYVELLVTS